MRTETPSPTSGRRCLGDKSSLPLATAANSSRGTSPGAPAGGSRRRGRGEKGFVLAGPDLRQDGKMLNGWHEQREPFLLETSVPGIFVAGDVRHGSVKRVASAVGEGSIAVQFAHQYLAGF